MNRWKEQSSIFTMKNYLFLLLISALMLCSVQSFSQGALCSEMTPFCTDSGAAFPASTNTTSEAGNTYGCLIDQPNPAWYYLEIATAGDIEITLTNSMSVDVDFIMYGPFSDLTTAQGLCGSLTATEDLFACVPLIGNGCPDNPASCTNAGNSCVTGDGLDCSYDPQEVEVATIPNGQVGEVYVFLITNFSNMATDIFANQTGGTGATNCSIINPCRDVTFGANDGMGNTIPLPTTIDCTDPPIAVVATPGTAPGVNEFITPAFGVEITTDANGATQNSMEIWDGPNATGTLLGYWGPTDNGGPYLGPLPNNTDFTGYGEYFTPPPTGNYSVVWCDNAGTGVFNYDVVDYANGNIMDTGTFDHSIMNCFTINIGAPTGTATFSGPGIVGDVGGGYATFDPSGLSAGTYSVTYTWDDGDDCMGSETIDFTVTCTGCTLSGGTITPPTTVNLCADDAPYVLSTTNEVTDATFPDVVWGLWVLNDPLGVSGVTPGGLPADQNPIDDTNFLGVLAASGTSVTLTPDGSGITYYVAPFVADATTGSFDPTCTGLSGGYTIFMNPPLSFNAAQNNCDISIDLTGGFPSVDNTADYSWSYTTPSGNVVTGTGTPITLTGSEDGDYVFSITSDGLGAGQCSLTDFTTFTLAGCGCAANAGTFTTPNGVNICFGTDLSILSNGDYAGSFEDGSSNDDPANGGDGDMFNGVAYGIYNAPPSNGDVLNDPNLIGLFGASPPTAGGTEIAAGFPAGTIINGTTILTNTPYYVTTIYGFDMDNGGLITVAVDIGADGTNDCFDTNITDATEVVFLDEILSNATQVCGAAGGVEVTFTFGGGLPTFDNTTSYTITGDGPGGIVAAGGTYVIPNHPPSSTYTITVTDEAGCSSTFTGNTIPAPTATASSTDVVCNGANDGTANVLPGGGTAPYTFSWLPGGATTQSLNNLAPGTYTVTITDNVGCTATDEVTVIEPTMLTTTAVADSVTCNNGIDGSITANPTGGTPPYTFNWSGTALTSQTVGGLSPGSYVVTVTDANGCLAFASDVIEQPPLLGAILNNETSPLCFGENSGSIDGVGIGGTPPYTYLWSNGQTTSGITNLSAGFYGLTITDVNNCAAFASTTLFEPNLLTTNLTLDSDASCQGSMDGQLTANVSGGTLPYTYSWSHDNGLNISNPNDLDPGSYTVTITDANGCTATGSQLVGSDVTITDGGVTTDALCNSEASGAITLSPSGSPNLPYSFVWSPNATTGNSATASSLFADTYFVTVTDAAGCQATFQYVINEPTALVIASNTDNDVTCNGDADGQGSVSVTGGTPGYTYLWSASAGNQTTSTASNLPAGTHEITVTDTNGCTITSTVNINEPTALALSTTVDNDVSCNAGTDGQATASATGGTPNAAGNYMYQWSASTGGQTTATAFNLPAGMHDVTVTDDNGCTITGSVTINEPTALTLTVNNDNDVSCGGDSDGQATAIAGDGTPPYSYLWSPSAGNQLTATATNLPAGTHGLTVTDANGCTIAGDVTLTEPPVLTLSTNVDNNVNCNGGNDGQATATAGGGTPDGAGNYTYQWDASAGNQTTAIATGLAAGTYTVIVTDDNGCTTTAEATLTEPNPLVVNVTPDSGVSCPGDSDGIATATVVGGTAPYTYLWSDGQTSMTATGLPANNHDVTITDTNGCTVTGTVLISNPPAMGASTNVNNNVSCNGGTDGSAIVNASGGTPFPGGIYTYQWSASAGSQTSATATGLPAGLHDVTVTDANGCTAAVSVTISEPLPQTLTINTDNEVSCNGGSDASATAITGGGTPGYTYDWSTSAGNQNTATATGLSVGTHDVTVTDANGCEIVESVIITEPTAILLTLNINADISCNGGADAEASVTASGGTPDISGNYTYQWSTSAGSQNTATANNLPAGTHDVTVTDANGCTETGSVSITEPTPVTATVATTNVSCNGDSDGSATVTASGGTPGPGGVYSYQWSANAGSAFTATVNGLGAGVYTVTISDINGCSIVVTITITEPTPVFVNITNATDALCNGQANGIATALVTGGTVPYTYNWGGSGEVTQTATMLPAGIHTVTVTDLNGCSETADVTINEPTALGLSLAGADPNCAGGTDGTMTANATGGTMPYSYLWSNGQTSAVATGLASGNYSVVITDANGCMINDNLTLNEPTAITLNITTQDANCTGACDGQANVIASGGAGNYTYQWDNGQTTSMATFLCPGTHTISVNDANGCVAVETFTIGQPAPLVPGAITSDPVSCFGGNDGAATITPAGGTPSYSYEWSFNGAVINNDFGPSSTTTDLAAGVYSVLVTDANGCALPPINITVIEPDEPVTLAASGQGPDCSGEENGSATVVASGGTPSYTYQWSANAGFQTTQTALNLTFGTYDVTVADVNGCVATTSVTITEPSAIIIDLINTDATCFGDENGTISVNSAVGGTPPYTYSIDGNLFQTDTIFFGLAADNYTIYVQDINGCTFSEDILVNQPSEVITDLGDDITIVFGDSTELFAQLNVPSTDTMFVFNWSGTDGTVCNECPATLPITPLDDVTYTVTALDTVNGCSAMDQITIFVDKQRNIFIPNIFSPNGDGDNDFFMVFGGAGVATIRQMRVYDRWGELLHEAQNFSPNDPTYGWDGKYKGKFLNPGVFVYYVEAEFIDGLVIPYKGDVTLVK